MHSDSAGKSLSCLCGQVDTLPENDAFARKEVVVKDLQELLLQNLAELLLLEVPLNA